MHRKSDRERPNGARARRVGVGLAFQGALRFRPDPALPAHRLERKMLTRPHQMRAKRKNKKKRKREMPGARIELATFGL